jgi:DNA-binding transcriptional regulator LsrR (DeoR family)
MARKPAPVDLHLLSKVARLYYEDSFTQQEIADRLRLSRPKVSRLLNRAHTEGIVQITVVEPPGGYSQLEQALEARYGLKEVVVVNVEATASQERVSRQIGGAAAEHLRRTIMDDDVLGIFWGVTLNSMVSAMRPCDVNDVHVVQMVGGLGPPEAEEHATDLCRRMARHLNSKLTLLPASGIVDSMQIKDVLLSDSHVQNAFQMYEQITMAYVGLGSASPSSWIMTNDVLNTDELDVLRQQGAVGETALRFFDAQGQPVESAFNDRVIGISLPELQHINRVVAMAGGPEKYDVVRAALTGGWIDVLITDNHLAQSLL